MSNADTHFHLIIAYPDTAYSDYLVSLIETGGYSPSITLCPDLDTLYSSAAETTQNTLLITDLVWNNSDASEVILSLALSNPRLAPIIVSNHAVQDLLPAYSPFPAIQGFEDAAVIFKLINAYAEDLRGQNFGAYQIRDLRGLTYMARTYDAYQPAIRRDVYLNIQPITASDEEKEAFRHLVRAQAGNIHPNIYALYEESEVNGRLFLSQEPVTAPTLFQLALQDFTFDARLLARVLNTAAVTLNHMRTNGIAHQPISAAHITLSEEGVIKMLNTALPRNAPIPEEAPEIARLASFLQKFIPAEEPFDPRLAELLNNMTEGRSTLEEVVTQSQAIDLALAPEKFIPQRQETLVAQKEITKAKKASFYGLIIGTIAFTLATIFILWKVLFGVVLEAPASNFQGQAAIPAGIIKGPGGKEIEVKAFFIDEVEVTIGQFEKFILDTEGQDIRGLLPPGWEGTKTGFQPTDWAGILKSIRTNTFYPRVGEKLTRDHPVFNIDYADAYAYAKWAGKRLPTEAEWQRAASGDAHFTFPWGEDKDRNFTNTGLDMNDDEGKNIKAADVDGFRGPAKVNEFRKKIKDTSPYGVLYMGGNVSEWVEATPEIGEPRPGQRIVRGGNFNTPSLVPNSYRIPQPENTAQPYIGLRCASDTLVGKQINSTPAP
jgi:formylglycine-generating enzyme required for sulfatase activity